MFNGCETETYLGKINIISCIFFVYIDILHYHYNSAEYNTGESLLNMHLHPTCHCDTYMISTTFRPFPRLYEE